MTAIAPAAGLALVAALLGYGSYHYHSQQQAVSGTETTTTDALEEGQVKLKGRIEADETVMSPVTGEDVVIVDWSLRGDARDEDRPDKTVRGRRAVPFDLVDDRGSVRVDPEGADQSASADNTVSTWNETVDRDTLEAFATEVEADLSGDASGDAIVEASGTLGVAGYTSQYENAKYRHEGLKPGDEITVVGHARRDDGGFVVGAGDGTLLLSDQSEEAVVSRYETRKRILLAATALLAAGSLYFLVLG